MFGYKQRGKSAVEVRGKEGVIYNFNVTSGYVTSFSDLQHIDVTGCKYFLLFDL